MTVYVDDVYIAADVPGVRSNARWCHLMADSNEELVEFASSVGINPNWIQEPRKRYGAHFDVVKSTRARCVKAGAVEIDWRDMGDILRQLRRTHASLTSDAHLTSKIDKCTDCGESKMVVGPYEDAANEEIWACNDCLSSLGM